MHAGYLYATQISNNGVEIKCRSRAFVRHHIKGLYRRVNDMRATVGRLSDIGERAYIKINNKHATVGHLSDIAERAYIKSK